MNTFASCSNNPYARKYLTKSRRSSDNFVYLDSKKLIIEPKNKRQKRETPPKINNNNNIDTNNTEHFNYVFNNNEIHNNSEMHNNNDFHDFYDNNNYDFDRIHSENYQYINQYENNQNIVDENIIGLINNDNDYVEEFPIDFIDDIDDVNILDDENDEDPPLYNGGLNMENQYYFNAPPPLNHSKSRRKQGIVGRPTLSSPKRLLMPDNVYSHFTTEKYFTDNNNRSTRRNNTNIPRKSSFRENTRENQNHHHHHDNETSSRKTQPRILQKPSIIDYRQNIINNNNNIGNQYYNTEIDSNESTQRTSANIEFTRNLVARAQRQGIVIDKNKIPQSVFEPEELTEQHCYRSSNIDYHHHQQQKKSMMTTTMMTEIKDTEEMMSQPFVTTVSIAESRRNIAVQPPPPIQPQQQDSLPQPKQTASDLLKQKWKAANRPPQP